MATPILPTHLSWQPSPNSSSRWGHPLSLVVVHRWGDPYTNLPAEARTYEGNIAWFQDPAHQVSAHIVFPGSAVPDTAAQMVAWRDMAWAEAAYNPAAVEIETADSLWPDADPKPDAAGLAVLARIVAWMLATGGGLHRPFDGHELPPVWSTVRGFCRHADLGAAGGGHTECPTTNLAYWRAFCRQVVAEYQAGEHDRPFRPTWGR